jgi:hypothetical protein
MLQLDKVPEPLTVELTNDTLRVQDFRLQKDLLGSAAFMRAPGPLLLASQTKALEDAVRWVKANCLPAQQRTVLAAITKLSSDAESTYGGIALTLDGALTNSHKTIEICTVSRAFFSLEFSDAQAKASGIAPGGMRPEIWPYQDEASTDCLHIESVTLDTGTLVDVHKRTICHVKVHATTLRGITGQPITVRCGPLSSDHIVMGGIGLDTREVIFDLAPVEFERAPGGTPPDLAPQTVLAVYIRDGHTSRYSNVYTMMVDIKR